MGLKWGHLHSGQIILHQTWGISKESVRTGSILLSKIVLQYMKYIWKSNKKAWLFSMFRFLFLKCMQISLEWTQLCLDYIVCFLFITINQMWFSVDGTGKTTAPDLDFGYSANEKYSSNIFQNVQFGSNLIINKAS